MLIVALLQLKLKQDVILIQNEQNQKQSTDTDSNNDTKETDTIKSGPSLDEEKPISFADSNTRSESIDNASLQDRENNYPPVSSSQSEDKDNMPSDEPISKPYQFFEMIGEKLKKYWKIGIHWLTALRNMLHLPFDARAIEILDSG